MKYLYRVEKPETIILTFGKVLRSQRDLLKLTQEKLAEEADLERTFISWLETGTKQATITTLFKLGKALRLKPSELLEMVEKQLEK